VLAIIIIMRWVTLGVQVKITMIDVFSLCHNYMPIIIVRHIV